MNNVDTSRKILFGIVLFFSIASTGKAGGEEHLSIERASDTPNDYFIRLVDAANPDKALDTVKLTTDQSITVIVQVRSARNPQWIEVTGYWSLGQGTLSTTTPVPSTPTSLWVINPVDTGSAVLTVVCGQAMASVPIIVYNDPGAIRLTLSMLTSPDSCFAGKPIRILVTLTNADGSLPGAFNASILLHDTLDNSHYTPLPWFTCNGCAASDSLDKPARMSVTEGTDTLELYLYAVSPNSDSLHQLRLTLTSQNGSGSLTARTLPFMLRKDPAEIRRAGGFLPSHRYPTIIRNHAETGVMQLRFNEKGRHLITIFSCSGRRVYSATVNGPEATIKLRQGVYILQGMREGSRVACRKKVLVR